MYLIKIETKLNEKKEKKALHLSQSNDSNISNWNIWNKWIDNEKYLFTKYTFVYYDSRGKYLNENDNNMKNIYLYIFIPLYQD